ncbi:nicotinic acetylcholine receptor alpha4 subunit-like protein [Leptotrombidium deliense]|uniref:Nicotinic acetylcholine receptor alpha4 subunit-like protein n=1 Tax=Leptotrombidium deliense TaxID=299467 RepID=A0A443S486_9ACAR|nr:nicotinic acetylcholine receptor alpha4 subunit-like protein [Leptotrombidium deliense]
MAPWIRTVFIHLMPRLLLMKRPSSHDLAEELANASKPSKVELSSCNGGQSELTFRKNVYRNGYRGFRSAYEDDIPGLPMPPVVESMCSLDPEIGMSPYSPTALNSNGTQINWSNIKAQPDYQQQDVYSPEVQKAIESILFIADHLRKEDEDNNVIEDWKYVAMVLDRLFLWLFSVACVVGTCGIILQAPSLYDETCPIDSQLSQIGR